MARARTEAPGASKPQRKARLEARKDLREKAPRKSRGSANREKSNEKKKTATRLADARARMYRELIFESAECIFGKQGYDGATMQGIADEAGVSLKTVYATFESKQDLYGEIMRQRAASFVVAMRQAIEGDLDPVTQLARIVESYIAFLFEHEDWLRIHLRSRVAWAFRPADEGVAQSWIEAREVYTRIIEDGMDQGIFYPGDAEEMVVLVQSIMQLQMARAVELGRKDPTEVAQMMMVPISRLLCR